MNVIINSKELICLFNFSSQDSLSRSSRMKKAPNWVKRLATPCGLRHQRRHRSSSISSLWELRTLRLNNCWNSSLFVQQTRSPRLWTNKGYQRLNQCDLSFR